jgi:hypothetical protein
MAMWLPLDTSKLSCLALGGPEPVTDFTSKRPKTDEDGRPWFVVEVAVRYDGQSEIWPVKVAGEPAGIAAGVPVVLEGAALLPWVMGERFGIAYRAAAIHPITPAPGQGPARAGGERGAASSSTAPGRVAS